MIALFVTDIVLDEARWTIGARILHSFNFRLAETRQDHPRLTGKLGLTMLCRPEGQMPHRPTLHEAALIGSGSGAQILSDVVRSKLTALASNGGTERHAYNFPKWSRS